MKKFLIFAVLAALLLTAAGCGNKAEAALDGEALVKALLSSEAFSQKLEELPSSKATAFYGIDASLLQTAYLYHASGISKEQIAVFRAVDETAAKGIVPLLQMQLDGWIEADRDYAPEEVPKLEKAVLRQSGEWVILAVANDPAEAARTVGEYI